jgi:hypothetical protein
VKVPGVIAMFQKIVEGVLGAVFALIVLAVLGWLAVAGLFALMDATGG